MRILIVAVTIALMTAPAFSQAGPGGGMGGMGGGGMGRGGGGGKGAKASPESAADAAKKKADDKAFNEAVKKIPVSDKKYDPWGGIRQVPK